MTITMNAPMTSRGLKIEANSDSPEVQALLTQIREASNKGLYESAGLQVSSTKPKTELGKQAASAWLNEIAVATTPELDRINSIPAQDKPVDLNSPQELQNMFDSLKGLKGITVSDSTPSQSTWTSRVSNPNPTVKSNGWGIS